MPPTREAIKVYNKRQADKAVTKGLCPRCKAEKPKLKCTHCQHCISYFTAYKALKREGKLKRQNAP